MTANGYIITTKYQDVSYYYKPTSEKWVTDIKKIAIGDIYFKTMAARIFIGNNKEPIIEDFPLLDGPFKKMDFSITTNII